MIDVSKSTFSKVRMQQLEDRSLSASTQRSSASGYASCDGVVTGLQIKARASDIAA